MCCSLLLECRTSRLYCPGERGVTVLVARGLEHLYSVLHGFAQGGFVSGSGGPRAPVITHKLHLRLAFVVHQVAHQFGV